MPPERKGLALGLVGLVRVVPIIVFSMISGVVADAWDRRQPDALHADRRRRWSRWRSAILAFRGTTAVWPIYLLAALGSAVGAFDLPARNALVPTLVPREHLPNAISLNTIMFQTASVARSVARRRADRLDRRRLGLHRQRDFVLVRHRRRC